MDKETYGEPSDVVATKGRVLVDGPDSVDVALTPDAAVETGERLIEAGIEANGQQRQAEIDHRPEEMRDDKSDVKPEGGASES